MSKTKRIYKKSSSIIDDILDDDKPRPKIEKNQYKKSTINIDDEYWSEEEFDYNKPPSEQKQNLKELSPKQKFKKIFEGSIQTESKLHKFDINLDLPLPYVPSHVIEILGNDMVHLIWKEFLLHECDETELLLTQYLPDIADNIQKATGRLLPFHKIPLSVGENEYTDFTFVVNTLAKLLNEPGVVKKSQPVRIHLPPCCANRACQLHLRIEEKYESGKEKRSNFRLDVIYRRMIAQKHGIVRVRDIPEMLAEAEIPFTLKNLPNNYMVIHGDKLVTSYDILFETTELLRGESDQDDDDLEKIYALPKWLKNEFTPNEILLFRHHFMMIDIDCGGTIDKHELQLLGESLGNTITEEEAEKIIAQHDTDGEGSLNFEEFMTLMFQILRGTIDMQNDVLAKTMMESRNQIKIFEEIESIKSFKPPVGPESSVHSASNDSRSHTTQSSSFSLSLVKVLHYGGVPVVCEYLLPGPIHTPYVGGNFVVKVIYENGYPFQCPSVTITTRLLHINFLPLIGGAYAIPHLERIWDSSWTTKELLEHIYELFQSPNPRLLPLDMIQVYNQYITEFFEITDDTMYITSVFQQAKQPPTHDGDDNNAAEYKVTEEETSSSVEKSYLDILHRMPRMRQLHMNLILKYFVDNENYEDMVRQAVNIFAKKTEYEIDEEDMNHHDVNSHEEKECRHDNEEETIMTNEYPIDHSLKYEQDEYEEYED